MSEFICPKCGNNKFGQRFHKENSLNDAKLGNNNVIFRYRYNDGNIEYNKGNDEYWQGCMKIRMGGDITKIPLRLFMLALNAFMYLYVQILFKLIKNKYIEKM